MLRTRRRQFGAALVAIALMASACSSDDDGATDSATQETTGTEDPVAAAEARVDGCRVGRRRRNGVAHRGRRAVLQ